MKLKLFLYFLGLSSVFFSQTDSSLIKIKQENYIKFNYENDFFSATDRYYTQGIQLSFIHPIVRYSPFTKVLLKLKDAVNYYGIHALQDCFTPKSIRIDTIMFGERPYTGTIFISHSLNSLKKEKKLLLQTQLDIGGIGKCARCEDEQKAIHKGLDNIRPLSWEYQLANDLVINYRVKLEKGIIYKRNFELMVNANSRLGTLYTDLGTGLNARIGFFDPYFNNLGLSKQPSSRKFKIYGVIKTNAKLVGYNATLQGGIFSKDIYVIDGDNVERFVFTGTGEIVVAFKRFSITYSRTYITQEYHTGVDHSWGGIYFTAAF
ncbi:MAG: lipid A deacylase LpxR family protein [Bacteroidetes bacterium]|nr:lipid A deacylase LpxR family protein [Bacteroidota bacterium]